jgi:mRNA-degrading endonuclease toxin of MazEF toxin-antitoxin module
MTNRADVVIARFPFVEGTGSKVRPAVVVQCDRLNAKIANTILAMVTGNLALVATEPTQFLIDPTVPDGVSSGLRYASAVKCENLLTVSQLDIVTVVGHLSDGLKQRLDESLKAALELP